DVILDEIARHLPKLSAALNSIRSTIGTPRYKRVLAREFPSSEALSIDYGVMEKAERIACIPGDFGWSDVGSFAALPEVRHTDADGNLSQGNALLAECR